MRFCPWYPLAEAGAQAPASAGVFQVRVADGLVDYPSGKSAMIHYEAATDLRAATAAFGAAWPDRPWLCRHTIEMTPEETAGADAFFAKLLREFVARFGAAPRLPS